MINNDPKWVDVDVEGEYSGAKYTGRFQLKPFLTHAERADAVRLSERYFRGIDQTEGQRLFLTTVAFLKFHIVDSDADWWKEDGLSLFDEKPIYAIADELGKLQNPEGDKKDVSKKESKQKK